MEKTINLTINNAGLAFVELNRPQRANAFSIRLLTELNETLEKIKYDAAVRTVIITGAGEQVFCAGADLKERANMNVTEVQHTLSFIRGTINAVELLPQPVIAAVNGAAFGGGTELALACDMRIAADTAKFALPETSLGIIPGAGGTQRLPRLIGKGKAKEIIFSGRHVGAQEAQEIGLVEYVTSAETLLEKAVDIGLQFAKNAPIAISQAKFAIDKGYDVDLETGLAIEMNAYKVTIPTEDRLEGLWAFQEKRPPVYKGK